MTIRKKTLIKKLQKQFPTIKIFDHDEFGFSAEDGSVDKKDWPLADYYESAYYDPEEKYHIFGISREMHDLLEPLGWTMEWINPGMVGLYLA